MNAREILYRQLMNTHRAAVARIAFSFSRHRAEREDLEQDIWFAIWRALPVYRGDASFRTFVLRIAHNRAISSIAARRPDVSLDAAAEVAAPEPSPESEARRDEQAAQLLVAVRRLPVGLRQAVSLRLEGLSLAEIGQVLGITENNATVRLNRARERLRQLLEASHERE